MSSKWNLAVFLISLVTVLSGCSTSYKQRQEERNRVAQSSGLYCEFVNGDAHNDVDVELNLQMAKKCDSNKEFNVTNYKNASDIYGVIFCCHFQKSGKSSAVAPSAKGGPGPAAEDDSLN